MSFVNSLSLPLPPSLSLRSVSFVNVVKALEPIFTAAIGVLVTRVALPWQARPLSLSPRDLPQERFGSSPRPRFGGARGGISGGGAAIGAAIGAEVGAEAESEAELRPAGRPAGHGPG